MGKKPTEPLKITAYLRDGRLISADGIVMFDSILYHAWFCKYAPEVIRGETGESYDGHIGLPLRHLDDNRYAASRGVYTETGRHIEYYNKYPDFFRAGKGHNLDMDSGQISSGVGAYRNYRNPVVVRTISGGKISFWCMGSKDKIIDLLDHIPAVGKKPSMGWGVIDRWTVEDAPDDYSLMHPAHGLMRPVPVDSAEAVQIDASKYPIMLYGVHPPYWKRDNARLCYVPIER